MTTSGSLPGAMQHRPSLELTSRSAQESQIAANWLYRLQRCMGEERRELFSDALRMAGLSTRDIQQGLNIAQPQLDGITRFVRRELPDITLRMFAIAELQDLGLSGYAAANSGSIGRAMSILYRYHSLSSDRYEDELRVTAGEAVVTTVPSFGHVQDLQNVVEDSFTGNWRSLQVLLGPAFDPARVSLRFEHAAPAYRETYDKVFAGAKLHFEAAGNELRFPAAWLDLPVDHAMQGMEDIYTAMCERVLGPGGAGRDTPQQVRRLLLSRPGRKMYRLEEAAEQLHLSTTQLRKRLYRAGCSYKQLVLEIRMELARHYLLDTSMSVQEIGYLLDYSQAAPFSRAFKLYWGMAPDLFRRSAAERERAQMSIHGS